MSDIKTTAEIILELRKEGRTHIPCIARMETLEAENTNNAGLLEVIERQGVEKEALQRRYNEVVEQRDEARYKLGQLRQKQELAYPLATLSGKEGGGG